MVFVIQKRACIGGVFMVNENEVAKYASELLYRIKWGKDYLSACNTYRRAVEGRHGEQLHLANDFFSVAFEALNYAMMMELTKLFDSGSEPVTIPKFLRRCKSDSVFQKSIQNKTNDMQNITENFEAFLHEENTQRYIHNIRERRDKYYAHSDKKYFFDIQALVKKTSVRYEDVDLLLSKSFEFCSALYKLSTNEDWHPLSHQREYVHKRNCDDLFQLLEHIK